MDPRIVVVTGATGAVGREVVRRFRQSGDTVCGISRRGEYAADLASPDEVDAVLARIAAEHTRIDVLVHAVGGFAGGTPIQDTPLSTWRQMMDLNFWTAVHVITSAIPYMIRARRGRVVVVGSKIAMEPSATLGPYGASKAALNALVRTLAAEVAPSGITANVVLPGTIDTEANRAWGKPDEVVRWVKPERLAETIFWLASDAASDINGALVPVYGRA